MDNSSNLNNQRTLGLFDFDSSTLTDVVGDTKKSNQSGKLQFETCTGAGAKNNGTWLATKVLLTTSLSDNNMTYAAPPVPSGVGSFIALPTGKSGFGRIIIGDAQEYSDFVFKADGTVTLINPSANVVTTETNDKLCITDGGGLVYIINEIGSTLIATVELNYNS